MTEIVVQYVWRIAIAAGMLFVTGLMAFMMDAQKDLPVDMGVSFPYMGSYDMKVWRHPRFCSGGDALLLCRK